MEIRCSSNRSKDLGKSVDEVVFVELEGLGEGGEGEHAAHRLRHPLRLVLVGEVQGGINCANTTT